MVWFPVDGNRAGFGVARTLLSVPADHAPGAPTAKEETLS
jgi:hypothetical protein